MNRTRWKLLAGGLALSIGGLAAVADGPAKPGPRAYQDPVGPAPPCRAALPPPVDVAAPNVAQLPPAAQPVIPAPLQIPQAMPAVVATPADVPAIPAPVAQAAPAPVVTVGKVVEIAPMPRPSTPKVTELTLTLPAAEPVVPVADAQPVPTLPLPPPVAKPQPAPPAVPGGPVVGFEPPVARPAPAAVEPAPAPQPLAPPTAEKKLKVMLHMGDDRPRFEVRDGDEVYLKVVCDKVDVKSPSDRGESMSTMKAVGQVGFVTPGGEGVCDELSVVPGTGQVVVTGKVSFKYNWGKVETTVSGDRMTFRLGSAPGQGLAPAATTIPTSFQRTR